MTKFITILRSMRLPFLVLTPSSLILGLCCAYASAKSAGTTFETMPLLLILLAGLFAHISVNMLNEYLDWRSGLDLQTQKTPFSGGSGALVDSPQHAKWVLFGGVTALALTTSIGGYFYLKQGATVIAIGLLGIAIILTYTQWLNRRPLLCLIAPGLAFGPLMVCGTEFALSGHVSQLSATVSLVPFFLCNNLLLLNQIPDIEADKQVGRRHFPIAYGVRNTISVYLLFSLCTALIILAGSLGELFSLIAILSALPLILTLFVAKGVERHTEDNQALIPYLGVNVGVTLFTPPLLGLFLVFF